jgi:hypothetical protein
VANTRRDAALCLSIVAAVWLALEYKQPYYFLQDDNLTSGVGTLSYHTRAVAHGELPLYNFHQLLGIPLAALGFTSAYYLPTYPVAALSQLVLGHVQGTYELIVLLHLLLGAAGAHALARELSFSRAAALLTGSSWPLCSMGIFTASSWWNASGVTGYFPWLICLALRGFRGQTLAFAVLAVARAWFFSVGHVQYFVYGALFEALLVATIVLVERARAGKLALTGAGGYALSVYATAALCLPVIALFLDAAKRSVERAGALPYRHFHFGHFELGAWLRGVFWPFQDMPDYYARPLHEWIARSSQFLAYPGSVVVALCALGPALLLWPRARRALSHTPGTLAFLLFFSITWVWATGLLDPLIYQLPLLNRFRWAFKLNYFVLFALVMLAGAVLTSVRQALGKPRWFGALELTLLAVQIASLAWLYLGFPPRPFNGREIVERPPLREALAERLRSGRIVSLGIDAADPYSAHLLGFDYASAWGLFQLAGYENMRSRKHDDVVQGFTDGDPERLQFDGVFKGTDIPLDKFRAWGVRWYVIGKDKRGRLLQHYRSALQRAGLVVEHDEPHRLVLRDDASLPLLHWSDTHEPVAIAHAGGETLRARFAAAPTSRQLVMAFLANDELVAEDALGRRLTLSNDTTGRVLVDVPAGVQAVTLAYRPLALRQGLTASALMLAAPLVLGLGLRTSRRYLRKPRRPASTRAA